MWGLLTALSLGSAIFVLSVRAEDVAGKRTFEEGIAAAQEQRWDDARVHFETSLAQADKPATRFNLLLVSKQLDQPLEVARHALAFLTLPAQLEHAAARAHARELLAQAIGRLATLTTDALPHALELYVDGVSPRAREPSKVYVMPGAHRLEAKRDGVLMGASSVELAAGQVTAWPHPPEQVLPTAELISPPPQHVDHYSPTSPNRSERARTRFAWAFGGMGAAIQLSALGVYLGAVHRAEQFGERDLFQPGVVEARDDSLRLQDAVAPLALTGGMLMAAAIATGPRATRTGSLGWSLGALASGSIMAGSGLALAVSKAPTVPGGRLPQPTRQAGYLLATSALPLLVYGVGFLTTRQRDRHKRALTPFGARW
jgi:hypothetical protein